jgi:hypothetical protein
MDIKKREFTELEVKLGVYGGLLGMSVGAILGWFVFVPLFAPLIAKEIAPRNKEISDKVFEYVVTKQHKQDFLNSEDGRKKLADHPQHIKQMNLDLAKIICILSGGFAGFVTFGWLGIFIARTIKCLT